MIKQFLRDETGLELSEYAVAAALIALAVLELHDVGNTQAAFKLPQYSRKDELEQGKACGSHRAPPALVRKRLCTTQSV